MIASHVSPPLTQDVYVTLKVSDNLHAALLPYMWALYARTPKTNCSKPPLRRRKRFSKVPGWTCAAPRSRTVSAGLPIFTPDFTVHYLAWARSQRWFPSFQRGLPILGVDGTCSTSKPDRGQKGK